MIIRPARDTTPKAQRHVILSKSAKYALRAALCLAECEGERPMPVDEIARRLDVPRNYLSKILHMLARTEILDSARGPGGGFRLSVSPEELRLADIVRHFDDVPDETTCLLGRSVCTDVDPCRAHGRWTGVRGAVTEFLDHTRLADLSREEPLAAPDSVGFDETG